MSNKTQKSQLVSLMANVMLDLVESGNNHPSKKNVLAGMIKDATSSSTHTAYIAIMTDQFSESIETYWSDVCTRCSEALDHRHYHLTSAAFYEDGCKKPETYVDATKYVVCFGNGRRGKAVGVRFVTQDDVPDAMYLVATQKQIEVVTAAIETQRAKAARMLSSPALSGSNRLWLGLLPTAVKQIETANI